MRTAIIILSVLFISTAFAGNYEDIRNLKLSKDNLKTLDIRCGAGSLKIIGSKNAANIEVEAEIVARGFDKDKVEDGLNLSLEKRGSRAVLISKFDNKRSWWGGNYNFYVNLTVKVPAGLNLNIDDGSGSIEIKNTAGTIDLDDGSGGIEIYDNSGDITLVDGSGSLKIENCMGSLDIDDGSGSVDISDLTGDIEIKDGSGSLTLKNIEGKVEIHDGSGPITIDGVSSDVIIREAGSGGVSIRGVKGTVHRDDD